MNEKTFRQSIGLFVLAGILLTLIPSGASAADVLYSIPNNESKLYIVDPLTGLSATPPITITLEGKSIEGGNGLATEPGTGKLWAILSLTGQYGRELVTIDPGTGIATDISDTSEKIATITFDSSGTLFGVTGSEAPALWIINKLDASLTGGTSLENGINGQAISFSPSDNLIYHASGNSPAIFEKFGTSVATIDAIPISGDPYYEVTALVYNPSNTFLAAAGVFPANKNKDRALYRFNASGEVTKIGNLNHLSKGLAFAPAAVDPAGGAIPEFPTVALPIASVIGLMFLFQRRKGK